MRRTLMTAAVFAATLATVALPAAASAEPYWHGGGYAHGDGRGWDRGWDRDWHRDGWREHRRFYGGYGYGYYGRPHGYARPPVVIYGGPYAY